MNPRVLALVAVALFVVPALVAASPSVRPPGSFGDESSAKLHIPRDHVGVSVHVDGLDVPDLRGRNFIVAQADTPLNVTVTNGRDSWLNGTLRFNASGVLEAAPDPVPVNVAPYSREHVVVSVHAEDVGAARLLVSLHDETDEGISGAFDHFNAASLPAVAIRFTEPGAPVVGEDGEYVRIDHRDPVPDGAPYARVRPDTPVPFRVEVENLLETGVAGFHLMLLTTPRMQEVGSVDVTPLEPGEVRVIEFPEWRARDAFGGEFHGDMAFRFLAIMSHRFGENTTQAIGADFTIQGGAMRPVNAAIAYVDAVSSMRVDVLVPKDMRLGVPARVKVELTNHETTAVEDLDVTLRFLPPGGLDYGVQGVESHEWHVRRLASGETVTKTVELTPLVTGRWSVDMNARWTGRGTGTSGNGFEIPTPVAVRVLDASSTGPARIGEAVDVDVAVATTTRLDDAVLLIASSAGRGWNTRGVPEAGGPRMPGLVNTAVDGVPAEINLGTLRPGDLVNATVTVRPRASGGYEVVPFILAGGFAYTSYGTIVGEWAPHGADSYRVETHARHVPAGLALAPFTVVLGVVVGAWAFRTRFVK